MRTVGGGGNNEIAKTHWSKTTIEEFFSEPCGEFTSNFAKVSIGLRVLKFVRIVSYAVFQKGKLTALNKHACISPWPMCLLSLIENIYSELQWLIFVCVGFDQYLYERWGTFFSQGGKIIFVEIFRWEYNDWQE